MIKSAKEAREIIKTYCPMNRCNCGGEHNQALQYSSVGYLAALEGPEVRILLEALEGRYSEPWIKEALKKWKDMTH